VNYKKAGEIVGGLRALVDEHNNERGYVVAISQGDGGRDSRVLVVYAKGKLKGLPKKFKGYPVEVQKIPDINLGKAKSF
jgi:hypothetical protein